MKYFSRLLEELKAYPEKFNPGDNLPAPKLLSEFDRGGGRKLRFLKMGLDKPGPAYVFIHGFGSFFMDWPRIMAPIAHKHSTYALDLPGWGFSDPSDETRGMHAHAEDLAEFIKHIGHSEVILCGISYGAAVVWATGTLRIPQIKKLVLLNPMPPFPLRWLHSRLYRLIFFVNQVTLFSKLAHRFLTKGQFKRTCRENLLKSRLLDNFYLELGYMVLKQHKVQRTVHIFSRFAHEIDWKKWEQELSKINVPTLILQGNEDKLFSRKSVSYLQSVIPGSRLEFVPDCGHAMVFDQHRVVVKALLNKEKFENLAQKEI